MPKLANSEEQEARDALPLRAQAAAASKSSALPGFQREGSGLGAGCGSLKPARSVANEDLQR